MSRPGEEHKANNPYQARTVSLAEDLAREHASAGQVRDTLPLGCRVGGCVIEDLLAEGGQGVVYRAYQEDPGRTVAIKTMRASALAPRRVERFVTECSLLAQNEHPGIVTLHEVGRFECSPGVTAPYLVMGYISSAMPITEAARVYGWSPERRIAKFLDACRAVAFLHKRGVRHFDLKPANILVDDQEHVRVSDLGLARSYSERLVVAPGGTLTHMSPEQCRGDPDALDHRSDIYSLGVVLYELLTGRLPIDIRTPDGAIMDTEAVFDRICTRPPIPLAGSALAGDAALSKIVMRALAKRPGDRQQSVDELIRALEQHLEESNRSRIAAVFIENRRRALRAALMLLLAVASTGAGLVAGWWLGERTGAVAKWEAFVAGSFPPILPTDGPLHAAVIEFGESTDPVALARARGVEGVTEAVRSHRALHGELAKTLASSGARAVVFDIIFRVETEFDPALAEGLRALRDAGVGVVVAAPSWILDDERGKPEISEPIWREADWGVYEVQITPDGRIWVPLAVTRRGAEPLASLALASYASSRADGARFTLSVDRADRQLEVLYWKPVEDRPGARRMLPRSDRLALTEVNDFEPSPSMANFGMREGDVVAWYKPSMLELDSMRRATRLYEEVLGASEQDLRAWFAGKVVFIGNFTARAGDIHEVGGRQWAGVYFHAIAMESLARSIHPRVAGWRAHALAGFPAAVIGASLPLAALRRGRGRVIPALVLIVVACVAPVAVGIAMYSQARVLLNPFSLCLAIFVTGVLWWSVSKRLAPSPIVPELGVHR